MADTQQSPLALLEFLRLEAAVRSAQSIQDLGFVIVNDTHRLVAYRQAFFCLQEGHNIQLVTISGLAAVDRTTPFHDWFHALIKSIVNECYDNKPQCITPQNVDDNLRNEWQEWLPEHICLIPLPNNNKNTLGFMVLVREAPFREEEMKTLEGLSEVYGYGITALKPRAPWYKYLSSKFSRKSMMALTIALVLIACFLPIRQTSLGTAEVTPLSYMSITAPLDGVIAALLVKPNEQVVKGQPLFRLEDTTIRNKLKSAELALDVARSEEFTTRQKAFVDQQSKGEIATQAARVKEKGSTINYMQDLMGKLGVKAPSDGIVLYGDPTDWEGRPITTGERIMMLADPSSAGVTVWVPVKDSVNLEPGRAVRLFLHTDPLKSRKAVIVRSSYQPVLSPEGVSSYRVTAQFTEKTVLPRIGLRGTGKVYGQWSFLGYQVFRRPLAAIRQKLGI